MDARPALFRIARMLEEHGLEAVLIGNAAAALHGAPVTTVDFDFMFRKTPANLRKLKALAKALDAVVLRPYYPASDLFRIMRDEDGLQIDFMATVDGVRSLASLRSRAEWVEFGDSRLLVATLSDVIQSKKAAGRPRDRAVLKILEKALNEETRNEKRKAGGAQKGK
jgi:Nucleotidyl transferase of unknown function (DUF2204)